MLTWINEKAKWVIVIFAAGIVVGLLAMDRIPDMVQNHPIAVVKDEKVNYADFDNRIKMVVQNQLQGRNLDDAEYAQLRNDIFQSFVRQILMTEQFENAELATSVAELKNEFKQNPDMVRSQLVQEAQMNMMAIQQQATSQEDAMQRTQAYLASLPKFLTDTTFDKAEFDAWLDSPEAFRWSIMLQLEEDLKTNTIPARQLQTLVQASIHPTTLESSWDVERRLVDYDVDVAFAANADFAPAAETIDSVKVRGYFNAHKDSFFVAEDMAQFDYVTIPVKATEGDDKQVHEYAMTIYYQLSDTSSAANFEDIARISSEDPGSAENGGLLTAEAGRGVFVPEFEKAALALDSGTISEPVKTQFGYHIIKCYGKSKDSTGLETAQVGHILLTVTASSQTVDSLENVLTSVKNAVDAGESLADAAKKFNLEVATSNLLSRKDNIQALGYLKGLASYAWPNENLPDEESKTSPVLKNNQWVVLAQKVKDVKAGERELDLYFDQIKNSLLAKESAKAASAYLTSVAEQVKAWTPAVADSSGVVDSTKIKTIEKVAMESKTTHVDGYVAGFGYSNPNLAKILAAQKEGEWSAPIETELGAVMLKVKAIKKPEATAIASAAKDEISSSIRFSATSIFNDYISAIENGTPVVNNMDLFYRD